MLQVITVGHHHFLSLHAIGSGHVQLDLGGNRATLVADGHQTDKRLVVRIFHGRRCDFDLLHQLAFVGIDGIEPIDHVVFVRMRRRVAQRTERVHGVERRLARPRKAAVHALWFIHDNDGPGGLNQVDRFFTTSFLAVFVEIIDILLVDGADGDHHDLDVRAGGEVAHLPQLDGIVNEVIKRHAGIQSLEMLLSDLQ